MAFENWDWVQEDELPQVGTQCPKCKQGYIQSFEGKSKKGNEYHGVKCDACRYKWTVSFKKQGTSKGTIGYMPSVNDRLDDMADYFKKEVSPRLKKIDDMYEWLEVIKDAMTDIKPK